MSLKQDGVFCIYRHLKPNGEVFYIGIGSTLKRPYETKGRNKYWKNKVKKYPNYEVQILKTGLTKGEACELETVLISWYGRADCCGGTLVNLTDGGETTYGFIYSDESKRKMSTSAKGKILSQETKDKISKYQKGRKKPVSHSLMMSNIHKGKTISEETILKMIKSKTGVKNPHKRISIQQFDKKDILIRDWESISDACNFLGLSNSAVSNNLKGLSNYCGGFKFKYK